MTDISSILFCALMSATGDQWHLDNRLIPQVTDNPELHEAVSRASQHLGAALEALQSAAKLAER